MPKIPTAPGALDALDDIDEVDEEGALDDAELGELLQPLGHLDEEDGEGPEDPQGLDSDTETLEHKREDAQADEPSELEIASEQLLLSILAEVPDDEERETELYVGDSVEPIEEEEGLVDEGDGPEEIFTDLGTELFPVLEPGEDGEGVLDRDDFASRWSIGDEPRPRLQAAMWSESGTALALEACRALTTADGTVVAASSDLLWFAPGSLAAVRLEAGSARIHSVALTGAGWEYAVCATTSGRLLRRGRMTAASEDLRGIHGSLALPAATRELFELRQPDAAFAQVLLLRSSRGRLLRSQDGGTTFQLATSRPVRALAPRGAPARALSEAGTLLTSRDGGVTFQELSLPATASELALGNAPLLACEDNLIALAESSLGLAVSADGGANFFRVPGTPGITALCIGQQAGTLCVFAAIYDDADKSWLIRVDVEQQEAMTLAILEAPSPEDDDDDSGERARIVRLEWEPQYGRLWCAGEFGLKVFEPVSGSAP